MIQSYDDGDGRTDTLLTCDRCKAEVWVGDSSGWEGSEKWTVDFDTEMVACPQCGPILYGRMESGEFIPAPPKPIVAQAIEQALKDQQT